MRDTIGLIHPDSIWHEDSKRFRGSICVFSNLCENTYRPGWYSADVATNASSCDSIYIDAFRPRRMK